jgi:hypothetical protein
MLLDVPYQGDAWWTFFGLGSLAMPAYFLLSARRKRKAGVPIDIRMVIGLCLWWLAFSAFALFQVLTHR